MIPSEAVWDAVRLGNVPVLSQWLQCNQCVNLEYIHPTFECSLLYSACRSGHLPIVKELVEGCAHINSQHSKSGSTPLHVAAYFGYTDIVEYLLSQGANPEVKNKMGLLAESEVPANRPAMLKLLKGWKRPTVKIMEGKLVSSFLVYGDRIHYLKGILTLLGGPVLTMKEEFERNLIYYEKASGYHKTLEIWNQAQEVLPQLKKHPYALQLEDEEIMALRVYTGSFYIVINKFLRDLNTAKASKSKAALLSTQQTWVSTITHLYSAVRKLSRVPGSVRPSYRGVDKPLRPDFFVPDRRGMIAATEFGFMSTSTLKTKALEFCGAQEATLFCIKPREEDASGYHKGVSVGWCSEFPAEDEVLFPPLTLFEVLKRRRKNRVIKITVVPTFV
uniref:NAD(P)(+)--arginine ADP-ribosyltransferase n=1 Tax=Arcella intermedia TaxID=1963864 RepID=A0A6B2L6D6_9EUKA